MGNEIWVYPSILNPHSSHMRIAVIVTTYNRPDALAAVLAGYQAQRDAEFELLVADDGSTGDTRRVVGEFTARVNFSVTHVWQEDQGFRAAAIRNRALAATHADYVIFSDGDCVPAPRFVAQHRRLAERGWFVAGNRVLLSAGLTGRALRDRLPIHAWTFGAWWLAWARRDINRWLPLVILPDGAFRKSAPQRWAGVKTCNLAAWRDDLLRVNAFDWMEGFTEIMKTGGFDAVIGNPPYIRIQTMRESDPSTVIFFKERYKAAAKGNYDIYVLFVEQSLNLIRQSGAAGFILPNKLLNAEYGAPLRGILGGGQNLTELVHFGANQVFDGATTYTCLLFISKSRSETLTFRKVNVLKDWATKHIADSASLPSAKLGMDAWSFSVGAGAGLEPVMHFLKNKAVLCKYTRASSLGWPTRKPPGSSDTIVMSAMKNGRFALLTLR